MAFVVVVLGSSKIANNVQLGENVRQQNKFALYTHSNDGDKFFQDNFENIQSFRTFLEQWEQMDKKVGNNEFSWEESIAIVKINKN